MYSNKDLDNKYMNEIFLINFNKKYKFNLNIIKNFKGFYSDCIVLLKNNNDINLIKKRIYITDICLLFNCYYIFFYYIVKKYIQMNNECIIINKKIEDIQLIDFISYKYVNFIKIIKLLIMYRNIKRIRYHFRHINLEFISIKVTDINTYKIIKYLIKNKIIIITQNDIDNFNYYKQYNKCYFFKMILKYIKIDIRFHDKTKQYIPKILLTHKSIKNKKLFDKKILYSPHIFKFYKNVNYFKNIKYLKNN